jgi:hypothetical protein
MTQDDSDPGFQIRDRRHSSGEPRVGPRQSPGERPAPAVAGQSGHREQSLAGLFMMLASLALAGLEGPQDPTTGQRQGDPAQAAEVIDILMLLREKTEGHRTAEENRVLDDLIYDLQVRYVRATRSS